MLAITTLKKKKKIDISSSSDADWSEEHFICCKLIDVYYQLALYLVTVCAASTEWHSVIVYMSHPGV